MDPTHFFPTMLQPTTSRTPPAAGDSATNRALAAGAHPELLLLPVHAAIRRPARPARGRHGPPRRPRPAHLLAADGTHWSAVERARFAAAQARFGAFAWADITAAVRTRTVKQVKAFSARQRHNARQKRAAGAAAGAPASTPPPSPPTPPPAQPPAPPAPARDLDLAAVVSDIDSDVEPARRPRRAAAARCAPIRDELSLLLAAVEEVSDADSDGERELPVVAGVVIDFDDSDLLD